MENDTQSLVMEGIRQSFKLDTGEYWLLDSKERKAITALISSMHERGEPLHTATGQIAKEIQEHDSEVTRLLPFARVQLICTYPRNGQSDLKRGSLGTVVKRSVMDGPNDVPTDRCVVLFDKYTKEEIEVPILCLVPSSTKLVRKQFLEDYIDALLDKWAKHVPLQNYTKVFTDALNHGLLVQLFARYLENNYDIWRMVDSLEDCPDFIKGMVQQALSDFQLYHLKDNHVL